MVGHSIATVSGAQRDAFGVLVALHVVAALVGFGGVALSGVYGGVARDLARPGAADDARRWFAAPNRAALAVLAVPVLGVGALAFGGRAGDLGQIWVVAALAVWLVAAVVVVAVIRPAEAELRAALARDEAGSAAPPGVAGAARRLSRAAAVCDVAFAVAVALMIWRPS